MPRSRTAHSSPVPSPGPNAAEIESAALASLQKSQQRLFTKSLLPKPKPTRKPIPPAASTPVAFPADGSSQPDTSLSSPSRRRPAKSGPSSTQPYKHTLSFPSSPLPPPGVVSRSSPSSAGQPAEGTALPVLPNLSPSLTPNSPVSASLSHHTRQPNTPTRSISVSQTRPSLSSPSPPTPIIPSILLRHATQRSPPQASNFPSSSTIPTTPNTPHSAPTTFSRASMDRHPSSKISTEHSPDVTSFATVSDPNLPSSSAPLAPAILSESNQYAFPLKQLLAKPAKPSTFHSGSESEKHLQSSFGIHRRSASATDSVQYASSCRNSDVSAIEFVAIRTLRGRPSEVLKSNLRDRNVDGYHYQRAVNSGRKPYEPEKRERTVRIPENIDNSGLWPDWNESSDEEPSSEKGKEMAAEPRPRNLLRRRPSTSPKLPGFPDPASPSGPRLSRSLSTTSFLKSTGLLSARSSTIRPISPGPKPSPSPQPLLSDTSGSPSPVIFSDRTDRDRLLSSPQHSHIYLISASQQQNDQIVDSGDHTDTTRDVTTSSVPTSLSVPSRVSKYLSSLSVVPPATSSLAPGRSHQVLRGSLSTISSGSSNSQRGHSRDRILSPAGAVADAYKREQLTKDITMFALTPSPRPPAPHLPPNVSDSDDVDLRPPKDMSNTDRNAENLPGSQRSSRSALSYAEVKTESADVGEKMPASGGEMKETTEVVREPRSGMDDISVNKEVTVRSSLVQSPHPSEIRSSPHSSSTSSPLASPPPRTSNIDSRPRNRLKKTRHRSEQSDASHTPYYTVVGARSDQIFSVGGPRDSFGANYTGFDQSMWGVRTTITAGAAAVDGEKEKESLRRSLSRKLSGKFKRERSVGDHENSDTTRGRPTWQAGRTPPIRARPSFSKDSPEKKDSEDRCLPYLYSSKKHAQSETDIPDKEKSSGMFPKFWRLFGRSKSRERSRDDIKTDDPPPLPALPKHYASPASDIYTPVYSRHNRGQDTPPPGTRKHPHSAKSSGPSTPSARPSTVTRSSTSDVPSSRFWNRTHSARSSASSLDHIPPMPNPLPNLTRYASTGNLDSQKPKSLEGRRPPRDIYVGTEDEPYEPPIDVERSDSPPIPVFSTADAINAFPPRHSSDRSKNSPTSPSIPSPTSPPPRPARSLQRPKTILSRTNSFDDGPLYPPVMGQSNRNMPKMTFREMNAEKRQALTEQEKADRWDALLEKSDAAGGTLHFGGDNDKLPSDDLRFSRTLSELAQDDE